MIRWPADRAGPAWLWPAAGAAALLAHLALVLLLWDRLVLTPAGGGGDGVRISLAPLGRGMPVGLAPAAPAAPAADAAAASQADAGQADLPPAGTDGAAPAGSPPAAHDASAAWSFSISASFSSARTRATSAAIAVISDSLLAWAPNCFSEPCVTSPRAE